MRNDDNKMQPRNANLSNGRLGGIRTDVDLRGQFNNRLAQAVAKLSDDERAIFAQRLEHNRTNVLAYDDTSNRTFERQCQAEELNFHRAQNRDLMAAIEAGNPPPPLMTNVEIGELAQATTQERVAAGQKRIDDEVRRDLNAHLERFTGMEDVLASSFEASKQFESLDQAMAAHQISHQQEHDMEVHS